MHVEICPSINVSGEFFGPEITKTPSSFKISRIEKTTNNHIIFFKASNDLIKYIFSKGYVSLNGISLTIGEVNRIDNIFNVYLIPETLRITTMQDKKVGDMINLEIETQTKNTVDLITEIQVSR